MISAQSTKSLLVAALTGLVLVAGSLSLMPRTNAVAEEKGSIVHLSYAHGYSNWGPTNVYGTAHLWSSEGVALLEVHDLPRLLNGTSYAWWIVNTTTGAALLLGSFNTSDAGDGTQDVIFSQAPPGGSNALLVTVRHQGDPLSLPGPQRTLAGFFAPLPAVAATATPGPSGNHVVTTPAQTHGTHGTHETHGASTPTIPRHNSPQSPARQNKNAHGTVPVVVVLPTTGGAAQAHVHSPVRQAPQRCRRAHACRARQTMAG